jgi:DNA-binding transcriptional MerR regulator
MEQAARLAGLSKRQLSYWDKTAVFSPSLVYGKSNRPYGRIYSFQDVVALRTLAQLRERYTLAKLRELGHWLKNQYKHPWSSIRFYVAGSEIVYEDSSTGAMVSTKPVHQGAIAIELEPIAQEARESLQQTLLNRDPKDIGVISRHRYTLRNEWAIAGTRIPVSVVQELHEAGHDICSIIEEFPMLTPQDVRAALSFDLPADDRRVS